MALDFWNDAAAAGAVEHGDDAMNVVRNGDDDAPAAGQVADGSSVHAVSSSLGRRIRL